MMVQAAISGLGLAYVTEWSVRDDLALGRLVAVLKDWTPPYPGLCAYYPNRKHMSGFDGQVHAYVRSLLVHGARAMLRTTPRHDDR